MYNTRIAPSPTGDMHIGTARTAYFNWLVAKSTGGKFILRIDDTDLNRNKQEYVDVIIETMNWLGLNYDEIVYQSSRFGIYKTAADLLVGNDWAKTIDGATVFTIDRRRKEGYIFPSFWKDEIAGNIRVTCDDLDHIEGMVLIKSDGSPTYNFCSIFDDLYMGVNFIVRGVDHITNTAKQVVLWEALTESSKVILPKFAHVGLIGIKGKPLSKRDGAASMLYYKSKGYDPDAMLNFMVRMGWGPKIDDKTTKMLPKEKMLEMFLEHGSMRSAMSGFDLDKLESFDRKYKASKKIWRTGDKLLEV